MANSRPESMIIPPGVFDETNISNKKSTTINGHSSSSSIDSAGSKNVNFNGQNSSPQNLLTTTTTTTSSTTTDSDFESEQDDNLQLQQQKTDLNTSEQLSRRVKHFHKLFKSEIPDDMPDLIDSYVCAYQGDILLQGKMFITDRYLCFHSRIINYVTKHVYRWEQIETVTKERVAFIFPTAIGIQLKQNGKKIIYASFLQRDQAYEKIISIWSRFINDSHSYEDDDNDSAQTGTLKATNHNGKMKYSKRESYDIIDGPEQEVLEMCLKQNSKRASSVPRKISEEKKTSIKRSNLDQKLPNESPTRHPRHTKNEQKSKDTSKRTNSEVNHPSQNNNHDLTNDIASSSSTTIIPNINSSITNSNSNESFNIIISFLNKIKQNRSTYSMKTIIIILLILTILFLHSFYLIKLAYRIENRLQALHHLWPSSSIKNSFSSNKNDL